MLIVAPERANELQADLVALGETVVRMGQIGKGEGVIYKGHLL